MLGPTSGLRGRAGCWGRGCSGSCHCEDWRSHWGTETPFPGSVPRPTPSSSPAAAAAASGRAATSSAHPAWPRVLCPCSRCPAATRRSWDSPSRSPGWSRPARRSSERGCGRGSAGPRGSAGCCEGSCGRWVQGGCGIDAQRESGGQSPETWTAAPAAWLGGSCSERSAGSGRGVQAMTGSRAS